MKQISRVCPWINSFAHFKKPLFSPEECGIIIDHAVNNWTEKGGEIELSGPKQGNTLDLTYRNVTTFKTSEEIPNNYEKWFVEKIYNNLLTFNDNPEFGYGFDLSGMNEPPMLMKYEASDLNKHNMAGKYDWHLDIGSDDAMSTRKIAYTIHLNSEYEGGELQWLVGNEPSYIERTLSKLGTITVFPSYLLHRVTPMTSGVRYVLVGWVHGDSFR
jgi:predicted 2-oxoglutarate/Fe(II)-dependent dioxygenase YbiX